MINIKLKMAKPFKFSISLVSPNRLVIKCSSIRYKNNIPSKPNPIINKF